ncbi:MAG: hypothetical protein GY898_26115 [Proteobacteria bacterium]|nr:hypothetical protein [Pseudomonadota bacterium]
MLKHALFLIALLLPASAVAQGAAPKVTFDIDGYYRARGHLFVNLYDKDYPRNGGADVPVWYFNGSGDDFEAVDWVGDYRATNPNASTVQVQQAYCRQFSTQCRKAITDPNVSGWFVQKGRFEPIITIGGMKLQTTIDVLDNVVWGDNENLASTPLFAGSPSETQTNGDVVDSIRVKRLWLEWSTAFGLLRVGRQPSNWGLGILANDGNGFKNDFGDSYDGSSFDRIIFATRPVSLVKGIYSIAAGKPTPKAEDDPGIILAVGFDRLVESSAITFRKNLTDDENLRDENDPDSNFRQAPIWLSDSGDDVLEMIYVLMFKREDWKVGKQSRLMDLTVGTYWVNRWQKSTRSNVWIPDIYLHWSMFGLFVEGEAYLIFGRTDAIIADYDKTTRANIFGTVWRVGYENPYITALAEVGHAAGDNEITDDNFTGRALHRDFNVGLILYEQVLAQRTTEKFASDPDTQGLWSNGGVYNSTYVNPRFKWRPGDFYEFRLGFLMAWSDEVDGAITPYLGDEGLGTDITESKLLGTEIDIGIHMKWADEAILVSLEAGYMHAGPRLGRLTQYPEASEATPYSASDREAIERRLKNIFTLQSRLAFVF